MPRSAIDSLKYAIMKENYVDPMAEALSVGTDDQIKDDIMGSIEFSLLGAESDPAIAKAIEAIPEYEEDDSEVEQEIDKLAESVIPTEY